MNFERRCEILGGVNKEQIEAVRKIDLLTYMQSCEPNSIIKCGNNVYKLAEHNSLKISNGKWYWFSHSFGGVSALDFLIKVRNMDFVNAVKTLIDSRASPIIVTEPVKPLNERPKEKFILPDRFWDNFRVISYLLNRGIDREIIDFCIKERVLYESREHHNCVFVGRNKENKAKFACLRGIYGRYMKDVAGSDKSYSFSIPVKKAGSNSLFVFESPIDALSKATIDKNEMGVLWNSCHRLALGGTSDKALFRYLRDFPEISSVTLCLDNDKTGIEAAEKIKEKLENTKQPVCGKYTVNIKPPAIGKDYNDMLNVIIKEKREYRQNSKVKTSERI